MKFVQWDNMHRKTILILQPEWNGTCISLSENFMVFFFFFSSKAKIVFAIVKTYFWNYEVNSDVIKTALS